MAISKQEAWKQHGDLRLAVAPLGSARVVPLVVTVVTGSSACAATWDVCARIQVLPRLVQMPMTFLLGNGFPEGSHQLQCFFIAWVRMEHSKDTYGTYLRICADIQKPGTSCF